MRTLTESSVMMLVADGLRPDVLDAAIRRGDVPELAALASAGRRTEVTTVFPSVTGVAYIPMLTGWHPAGAGVPGLRWYDRNRGLPALLGHSRSYVGAQVREMDRDLDPNARTLFEIAGGDSLGSMAMLTRGLPAAKRLDHGAGFAGRLARAHVAGDVAQWARLEEDLAERLVDRVRRERPRFVFAAFTAGDKAAHAGPAWEHVARDSLRLVDDVVGRLRRDAERDGRWPRLRLWIVSDHGHSPVSRHVELAALLRDQGIRVRAHPWTVPDRSEVAVMVSGNSMAHVYLGLDSRNRLNWPELEDRWLGRVGVLWSHPAVDLLAARRGAGTVEVWKGGASAMVEVSNGAYSYRIQDSNPLGIEAFERASEAEALDRCRGSEYPDGVVQLAQAVLAGRSGDLVVSATRGWDLRIGYEPVEHRSSHGALHAGHMVVPLVGTGLPDGAVRRTGDLFTHAARVLGEP